MDTAGCGAAVSAWLGCGSNSVAEGAVVGGAHACVCGAGVNGMAASVLMLGDGVRLVLYQWLGGATTQASCPSGVTRKGACSARSG